MFSFALLVAAVVAQTPAPTPPTPSVPTFPACFFTFELSRETTSSSSNTAFEGGSVTVDSSHARTDALMRTGPMSQVIYTTIQTPTTTTFVTDDLNGTASCMFSKGMFDPVPTLPNLTFVGTSTWAGAAVNHWSGKANNDAFDYYTLVSDNDLPVMLTVTSTGFSETFLFKHTARCQAGSVDPGFFAVPAGLSCKQIPFVAMPAPMSVIMKMNF